MYMYSYPVKPVQNFGISYWPCCVLPSMFRCTGKQISFLPFCCVCEPWVTVHDNIIHNVALHLAIENGYTSEVL